MKSHSHKTSWIVLFLVVILTGAAAFYLFPHRLNPGPRTEAVRTGPIVEAVYGVGTVTARNIYQVKVGVTLSVQKVHVRVGDLVKKGQALAVFETMVPVAPFDGVVTEVNIHAGETTFPQVPLITITDLKDRYIIVSMEQQGAIRIREGQSAKLSFESLRAQTFTGKVKSIFPHNGDFNVVIESTSLPPEILPGMTCDVAIEIERRASATLVPVAALSGGRVIIQNGRQSRKVELQIGTVDGEWAEVVAGEIKPGDEVVVKEKR